MVTPFQLLQDEWVMLAPLGDHTHALGIQRFTPTFIANMANRFNGFFARMGRLFSGAPTFEGHHDIEPDKYPNSRSYGWIMALEARPDGLWGKMTWTPEGRDMLQNGAFKFVSPVFIGKPIGQENGKIVFEPIAFKSLALTNEPNLPLPPLANTKNLSPQSSVLATFNSPLRNTKDHMETITQILNLTNEASAEEICSAVRLLKNSVLSPRSSELKAALTLPPDASAEQIIQAVTTLKGQLTTLQNDMGAQSSEIATLQGRAGVGSHPTDGILIEWVARYFAVGFARGECGAADRNEGALPEN